MTFGERLRELRRERGLSLRAFAAQVNYSHTYLWELETGRKQPGSRVAAQLDTALSAAGTLSSLGTEGEPTSPIDTYRRQFERTANTVGPGTMAQLAAWLYDTYVRSRPPLLRLGAERYSRQLREQTGLSPFRIEATRQGRTPTTECRSVTVEPAPPDIAACLRLPAGAPVIRRENWYAADGEPVQLATTYIPTRIAGETPLSTSAPLGHGGLYGQLAEIGHQLARFRERVITCMPTPAEAKALRLPPGVPLLVVLHTSIDNADQPFEVTRFAIRADLAALDYQMAVTE
ncbi:GntR family transcriptional regulator [Dactylosporangium sp. CS-047395]|uniref:GntR family transcriptional regulator n=1 Tax=Dactylosporangium sp. CS-047395 TaxID=3239936 RepID=UPI003D8DBB52